MCILVAISAAPVLTRGYPYVTVQRMTNRVDNDLKGFAKERHFGVSLWKLTIVVEGHSDLDRSLNLTIR